MPGRTVTTKKRRARQRGGSSAIGLLAKGDRDVNVFSAVGGATQCSPARYDNALMTGTCLTAPEVLEVAAELGIATGLASVGAAGKGNSQKSKGVKGARFDPAALMSRLHERLGTRPGEEDEWIKAPEVARRPKLRERLSAAFRPEAPEEWEDNPSFWLSNLDIEAVMGQYEDHLGPTQGFRFLGVVPRDFASPPKRGPERKCVSDVMCQLSVREELAKGSSQLGTVFNLDKHTGNGSHWTSAYIGLDPARPHRFGFWYYDSVGRKIPAEMKAFAERLKSEVVQMLGPAAGEAFVIDHNPVRKQFLYSECGIYAMFFIVACVQTDLPFEQICSDVMKHDRDMHKLRSVFFR